MLSRLGEIAIPHTVCELMRVLDHLDPAPCFDLFAHALTVSGQKYRLPYAKRERQYRAHRSPKSDALAIPVYQSESRN